VPGTGEQGALAGRRVLVTGASSGIGEATARACAGAGAQVACLARRIERLTRLAQDIGGVAVAADVADEESARAGVDEAADALGGLDAVVNNAGAMTLDTVSEGRPADWRRMLDVNVLGLLVVTQAALAHLRAAGGGDVVNMSSLSGRRVPNAAAAVYAGTKHAVHAISDGLRRELHPEGIRVTIVSPGLVDTELGEGSSDSAAHARVKSLQADIGLSPSDVGRQVLRILAEPPHVVLHEIALLPTAQG
jgi:clavulanate-9-aldehyde reducatase